MATVPESNQKNHDSSLDSPLLPPRPPSKEPAGWESGPEKLCIDDMLQKYCGEFGSWQLRHFVLTSLAWALEAFHTMVMIFADQEPGWRCVKGSTLCDEKQRSVCGFEPGSWEWDGGSGTSTVAQWELVCSEKYKVGLVQALFFGGCMIGELFPAYLSLWFLYILLSIFALAGSMLFLKKKIPFKKSYPFLSMIFFSL